MASAQPRLEFLRRHRLGEGVALEDRAAEVAQQRGVLHRLDPFGYDFDVERAADFDNRANETALSGGAHDRRDQLTVDLQPPRLDLGQADDRRIAAAEIVDLDVDAERLDLLDVVEEAVVAFVEIDRFRPARTTVSPGSISNARRRVQ